jgi:hypothetical protein
MARKEQTLTCTFFVGGKQVDRLTEEQCERMAQKVGEVLSIYYTAHPEEYSQLKTNSNLTKN